MLPDFKAVIFDLDGLLLETEETYFIAWRQAADALGYSLEQSFCCGLSGLSFAQIKIKLIDYLPVHFPFDRFYRLSGDVWRTSVEREGIVVKKGVHEIVEALNDNHVPFCVATNSPEMNARECLQYGGISDLFPLMVCIDSVLAPKPAPDLFLQAASQLQQPIEKCLVVEDSLTGLLAADQANAFSILVPSVSEVDEDMQALAGFVVQDLSVLSRLLVHVIA